MSEELFHLPSPPSDSQIDNDDDSQKTPTQPVITLPATPHKGLLNMPQTAHLINLMPGPTCLESSSLPSVSIPPQYDIQVKFLHILRRPPTKLHTSVCHVQINPKPVAGPQRVVIYSNQPIPTSSLVGVKQSEDSSNTRSQSKLPVQAPDTWNQPASTNTSPQPRGNGQGNEQRHFPAEINKPLNYLPVILSINFQTHFMIGLLHKQQERSRQKIKCLWMKTFTTLEHSPNKYLVLGSFHL